MIQNYPSDIAKKKGIFETKNASLLARLITLSRGMPTSPRPDGQRLWTANIAPTILVQSARDTSSY